MLARVVAWIDWISEWSGRVAAWLTLVAAMILTYEVVARYVFARPTRWAHDTSTLLFGVLYVMTGAYAQLTKNHVGVDVIYTRLSPRVRAGLDVVTSVLFYIFVGAFFWYGWSFFSDSFARREFSLNNSAIPIYPAKFAIPVGAGLLLLQGTAKLIRDVHLLITGRELGAPVAAAQAEPQGVPAASTYGRLKREGAEQ